MSTSDKRRRDLAREKAQRQEQRRHDAQAKRRRRAQIIVAVLVGALVLTMAVGIFSSLGSTGSDSDAAGATGDTGAGDTGTGDTGAGDTAASGACDYIDNAPDPTTVTDVGRPPGDPGELGELTATMTLNGEQVVMTLDGASAPCTASSWEFLAAADYFDDTVCHRLTTSDTLGVLQCGDPSGTGRGGPGYRFAEENLDGAVYAAGTVAMANAGQPASTGSQFFVVHSDSMLPPSYTVVGQVIEGLDVVEQIAAEGTVEGGTDGSPAGGADVSDLVVERS